MGPVRVIEGIGSWVIGRIENMGDAFILAWDGIVNMFRPPFRWRVYLQQLEFVGFGSLVIVLLTGAFTGMVTAVQGAYAFSIFNAEGYVGVTVALALTRELGPVLTGLMVTGRVGSSIATEIGTMVVTEQVDALQSMAVNPVQYLVSPRLFAGITMMPVLTLLFSLVGIAGAYIVVVIGLGLDAGVFKRRILDTLVPWDIWSGLIKSAVFGGVIATIGCHSGYSATGGARGVGLATTRSVVYSSVAVLVVDYFLTVLMY